jgi:20S proteasome alpha/beta subunit
MTTIFGIKTPKAAVLVADRQTTSSNVETGMPQEKFLRRKLWVSEDQNYCVGHFGLIDRVTSEFIHELTNGKYDMRRITEKGYFPQLRKLNTKRMGNKLPDLQTMSGLILATRFDKNPRLFSCFPLGSVEEREWTTAGSGDKKINEYMAAMKILAEAKDYQIDGHETDVKDLVQFGLESVRRSQSQDIYSHGLDMLVCLPEEIRDHYAELGDDFGKKLESIQQQYEVAEQDNAESKK